MRNLILLAHPDPERLRPLIERLEAMRYNCLTAHSGAEALAAAHRYSPQMVITHAELPELQGTEVCLRLKQDPTTEAIAVLLIAQDHSVEDRFVGQEVGADAYLVEPLELDSLAEQVSEMFRSMQLNAKSLFKR